MTNPHINTLRDELLGTMRDLRNRANPMEPDRARAIAQVAGVLVDSARVEVDYLKATGQDVSNFIDGLKAPDAVAAIANTPTGTVDRSASGRALLVGTKTQTRRVVKTEPVLGGEAFFAPRGRKSHAPTFLLPDAADLAVKHCPYGQPGDRLWVREAFEDCESALHSCVIYRADGGAPGTKWTPSIHMPRWASRITLEVTGVRVERLQDISEADAIREGIELRGFGGFAWYTGRDAAKSFTTNPVTSYSSLWESINGLGSWDANPWVWVVEFKRVEGGAQ